MEAFTAQDRSSIRTALFLSSSSSSFSSSSSSASVTPQFGPTADREHMFDKVVTPSDVGKLNRLVIPKQHAERFFPLEPSSADKGLVLVFEDRCAKQWSFRYSYWNSSQSYVITKGWSRFVKEKRLDAGDTVSFSRVRQDEPGGRQPRRLFIDIHHRTKLHRVPHPPIPFAPGPRQPLLVGAPWLCYRPGLLFPAPLRGANVGGAEGEVVLESVPVMFGGGTKAKRLRLFGVNLDCPEPGEGSGGTGGGGQLLLPAVARQLPTCQRRAGGKEAAVDVTEKTNMQATTMYIRFGGDTESEGRRRI